MSLFIDIYEAIKAKLDEDFRKKEIKHFGRWNQQVQNSIEGKQSPFAFPAVFISFPEPIDYSSIGGQMQEANPVVRVYIVDRIQSKDQNRVFDLAQRIFFSLNLLQSASFRPLERIAETNDEDHDYLYLFAQDYQSTFCDNSADVTQGQELVPQPIVLEVEKTVIQKSKFRTSEASENPC